MGNLSMMASLGVLISGADKKEILPEEAILLSFTAAMNDYRALVLIHTWMQLNHDLIHVEALISALKRSEAEGLLKLVAGALYATKQKRFERIFKMAKAEKVKPTLGKLVSFAAEIGQCAEDPSYAKFGLKVSEIELEAKRKFRPREYLIHQSPFFFCRILFGVNWRADVAACFLIEKAKNPTEISKFLGCSYDAAYRNYHDLLSAGWDKKTRRAFTTRAG